jgi:D-threo-aldose 1-dehydrogenase
MPGTYGYSVSTDQAKATLKAIFAGPVPFLDTSRIYGDGRSEARIGETLKEIGGLPDGFIISSKVDRDFSTGAFDGPRVRRSFEESLKAMGVDRIPILHLHDPEYAPNFADVTKPGGGLAELFKIRDEGLVDAVGLAAGKVEMMMPLLADWDFDTIITHNRFTLVSRHAEEMIDFCVGKGIAVMNAAPYASGVLAQGSAQTTRYAYQDAPPQILEAVRKIEEVCARHRVPTGAAALQFSMRDKRIASTVIGVTKPERIAQTLEWANWPIPEVAWDELYALPFTRDDPEASRKYTRG